MLNRRTFLKSSSLAVASMAAARLGVAQPVHQPLGVQLFSVRKQITTDLNGVLAQIRAIGYEQIEPFGPVYAHPVNEVKDICSQNGLTVPSGHFDYDTLESKLDYASTLGMKFVVCPMLPERLRAAGADGFRHGAERLNQIGEAVHARGMKFCFHNHNYEFKPFGNTTGFDILMQHTDPNLVGLELDCYWAAQAGRDPIEMLQQYANRVHLLHLKDRKPGYPPSQELNSAAGHFTDVGSGTINWPEIVKIARRQSVHHFFVDQDDSDHPPIESLTISYRYLRKIMA